LTDLQWVFCAGEREGANLQASSFLRPNASVIGDSVSARNRRETRSKDNQQTRAKNRQTKNATRARGSIAVEGSVGGPTEIAVQATKIERSEAATKRRGMSRQTLNHFETGARDEREWENES
jgi:hypothetical protein